MLLKTVDCLGLLSPDNCNPYSRFCSNRRLFKVSFVCYTPKYSYFSAEGTSIQRCLQSTLTVQVVESVT